MLLLLFNCSEYSFNELNPFNLLCSGEFDIETIERVEIIRDLRLANFDVLVGINLLREGLDIP